MDEVSEQERQAVLAEQAPRLAEAQARVANPEPMEPGIIEKVIAWLRGKMAPAEASPPSRATREVQDVAGGLAARQKLEAQVQDLLRER